MSNLCNDKSSPISVFYCTARLVTSIYPNIHRAGSTWWCMSQHSNDKNTKISEYEVTKLTMKKISVLQWVTHEQANGFCVFYQNTSKTSTHGICKLSEHVKYMEHMGEKIPCQCMGNVIFKCIRKWNTVRTLFSIFLCEIYVLTIS